MNFHLDLFAFPRGSSRIKEMYDIEMAEANKLIDATKRDAAAANMKFQQTEKDLNRLRARCNEVTSVVDTDRKNVETLQRQIAENEAVRSDYCFFCVSGSLIFSSSKSRCSVVECRI